MRSLATRRTTVLIATMAISAALILCASQFFRLGVLVSSTRQSFVIEEVDYIVPYDGQRRSDRSEPFDVTLCTYWTGLGTRTSMVFEPHMNCPLTTGPS